MKCLCWCVKEEMRELVQPGGLVNNLEKRFSMQYEWYEEIMYDALS